MSTVARQKRGPARVLLERKCRFLGRFYAKELSEANLARLRNHIRLSKGQKTKLRLTSEGIGSGSKFGTIFKNKLPAEFTPLRDIIDIVTDNRFSNVLCIAMRFPDGNYEIQAYRMYDDVTARQFQYVYADLCDKFQSGTVDHTVHVPVNYALTDHNTTGQWSNSDNWMLKDEGHFRGSDSVKRNGLRKTTSLYDAFDTTDSTAVKSGYPPSYNRLMSPSWTAKDDTVIVQGFTSAKGNIGKKLGDVSARDIDYHMYAASPVDDDSDRMSQGSDEELRWRLHNLSREVDQLRATIDEKQSMGRKQNNIMMNGYVPRDNSTSRHYVLTHHRDLDDKWSDDGSDISTPERTNGDLVDSNIGSVKAVVRDYRYHGNTNQSNSQSGYHSSSGYQTGSASTRIGQARRMNGHVSRAPNNNESVMRVNNDPNHLVYKDTSKEVRKGAPSTWAEHRGQYAGNHDSHSKYRANGRPKSAEGHYRSNNRAASDLSFHGGNTLATAKVSRPVDKIYLPSGNESNDFYVIDSRYPGNITKQRYANSVIGAPRYNQHKNRRQ